MERGEAQLNRFLVEVFHDVMRLEEQELLKGPFKNLSVSEMHVIEAACDGQDKGSNSIQTVFAISNAAAEVLTGIILFFMLGCEFFITYKLIPRRKEEHHA